MTCDCPIVFAEDPELCDQVHRYDCPNAPRYCPDCGAQLRADQTCGNLCDQPEGIPDYSTCEQCGEPATHLRDCTDVTPTDRGEWVQRYQEWQCDSCDPGWR